MPAGRPSLYQPEYAEQARKLCELGATDREIAGFFDVAESTVNNWKLDHPEFLEALKTGKDAADERVERSLYHRAIGYDHPEVHVSNYQGQITLTPIVKQYAPDTTAAIFWLKNRRKDQWRDVSRQEQTGPDGAPVAHINRVELVIIDPKPNASD